MKCFNCGKEIDLHSEKCSFCNVLYTTPCENCGNLNPEYGLYCFNCGFKLNSSESKGVLDSRKNVAVIFADISGFTSLSEKMDPEEVRDLINDCFDFITKPVYEMGGSIDKYIGDCVMILFGSKTFHIDDANRAVICSLKMMELIAEFSKERQDKIKSPLSLSIGINYGLVFFGGVGNNLDKDYTVLGDVVNTASRLQSAATTGSVLVSESVYRETKDTIEYGDVEIIKVKNKELPVKCYKGKYIKEKENNKILVNRSNEIASLKNLLTRENKLPIFIIGPEGTGKTSLIKEALYSFKEKKKIFITLNYNNLNRVNYTISSIITGLLSINPYDSERIKKNRLNSYLDYILSDYNEDDIIRNSNFLGLALNLSSEKEFSILLNSMKYEDIKEETKKQIQLFFNAISKKDSPFIIIDDMEFCDEISLEAIKEIVKTKIQFVFLSKLPIEYLDQIGSTINLNNFSLEETVIQIKNIINCRSIESELKNKIFKISGGNPLFVNEIVNTLESNDYIYIENNILYIKNDNFSSIPSSLEKIVLWNLNYMEEKSISFLNVSSIIGKDFNISYVNELLGYKVADEVVKDLISKNFISLKYIKNSSKSRDIIYTFNQDFIRDAIYGSVPLKVKRDIHKKIAFIIESNHKESLTNYYEILCYHYEKGNLKSKAKEYYYKTGEKDKNLYAYKDAIKYYLNFLNSIGQSNQDLFKIKESYMSLGLIYSSLQSFKEAEKILKEGLKKSSSEEDIINFKLLIAKVYEESSKYNMALDLISEIEPIVSHKSNLYGKILQLKTRIYRILGNKDALKIALDAEENLIKTRDYETLGETLNGAGILYFINGDLDNSLDSYIKALGFAEKSNNLRLISSISINLGIFYHSNGEISKALDNFTYAMEISTKISNIKDYLSAEINLGILYLDKGLFHEALPLFIEAADKSSQRGLIYVNCIALTNIGDIYLEKGNYKDALENYQKSCSIAIEHSLKIEEGINYIGISKVFLETNEINPLEYLEKSRIIFEEAGEIFYLADYYRLLSIYYSKINDINHGKISIEKALDHAKKGNSDLKYSQALRVKADLFSKIENPKEALDLLNEAKDLAIKIESNYEIAITLFAIYNISLKLKIKERKNILKEAKEAVSKISSCKIKDIILNQED